MQVQVFIMSYNSNKEKMESSDYKDICRNHSAKADREMYRVCPSKLSKRELEDLYFTLLENNLELKKTINGQQDKIRVLSTQVQRMTYTQEKLVSKEKKDRGTATKAVVDGQKDFITELKETNQRLSDRVQHLNMRLCSAKQFMKTTQPHSAPSKGNRSSATAASTPKRHDCTSKGPESSEQVLKVSTYSQWEENYVEPVKSDQPCDENKCRTLMEDMKLKIATLKTELVNVHEEYATRIGRLETEVLEVRKENIRVISERSASECELTDTFKRASDLLAQYRTFEAKCAELTTELAIERRKVAELETQLRAANMSDKVNKTIEDHLTTKQNASSKCMKCCFKDEHLAMGSHPPTGLSPSAGATSEAGDPCTTNTGDDSGYQDTDEQGLLKQNKELIAKILELQRQVDSLKIRGVGGRPGCSSENLSEFGSNPKKTADNSAVVSLPPLLDELPKVETPVDQIEQSLKDKKYESMTPLPSEHVIQPRKIIRIEVLGNPKESFVEDSRAKTIENADGTQYITDDPVPVNPDKYGYPDLPNKRHTEHGWDSPKLEIVEKKKHEENIAAINKHDSGNINLKTAMSLGPGPGFNPEKFKYLEAEGLTADVPIIMRKESLQSIPSNPELGFGIPKLVSKISQERSKAELDSGRQKKSLGTSTALPREPVNQSVPGTHPITSTQTDDTHKLEEDCQHCDACSFDMECAHGIKPTMDKLALEVQKERDKEHDQHNSLQIPGPIVSSDIVKKDKKSLFSHFKKQKKGNQSSEDLVTDPKVYAKKTSITAAGAVNIADVPLFEKSDQQDKKHKPRKRKKESQTKEDLIVNSRVYAQRTCETVAGAVALADVPVLDNQVVGSSKDRRAKDSNEDKADTNQKLPEKSSQAASCKDWSWQSDELPYRRRSGTYSNRARSPGQDPAVCRCVGRQDGACYLPKNKGIQAAATQENMSPREKRRAVPTSERGTYTLDSKHAETSPDNTDLEMSYLSDLPMEKEKKSPFKPRPLSPGEARSATHSYTQSGPSPPTNYSLSEGEMPAPTKRRHTESDRDMLYLNAHLAHKLETPPLLQMEAALQAITDELQRCRNLLHHQRPAELSPMSPVS